MVFSLPLIKLFHSQDFQVTLNLLKHLTPNPLRDFQVFVFVFFLTIYYTVGI